MKKYLLLCILTAQFTAAQTSDRFVLSINTELADKYTHNSSFDYGINVGADIEYQMSMLYFKIGAYAFPGLNHLDYFHVQGTVLGFNYRDRFDMWRYHIGILKPGFIIRDGGPHALMGLDAGVDYSWIGIEVGWDWKEDSKIWGEDGHGVWYCKLRFNIEI